MHMPTVRNEMALRYTKPSHITSTRAYCTRDPRFCSLALIDGWSKLPCLLGSSSVLGLRFLLLLGCHCWRCIGTSMMTLVEFSMWVWLLLIDVGKNKRFWCIQASCEWNLSGVGMYNLSTNQPVTSDQFCHSIIIWSWQTPHKLLLTMRS